MQEENTVQEQEQTPRVSRVREYMTAKFPDREFGDDSELEQALYDYLTQSDKKIAGHEAANKTIMEVVQAYPEFAPYTRAPFPLRRSLMTSPTSFLPISSSTKTWRRSV